MADYDSEAFWIYLREHGRLWEAPSDRTQDAPPDVGDYDIVVTADRIVERRTVRAKSFVVSESAAATGTNPSSKSYKTYQTVRAFQNISGCGGFDTRKWLPWRYLAVVAVAGVTLWLAAW